MQGVTYTNPAGVPYLGTLDMDNSVYYFNRRYLPSQLDALILKDVYGYTITPPQTLVRAGIRRSNALRSLPVVAKPVVGNAAGRLPSYQSVSMQAFP